MSNYQPVFKENYIRNQISLLAEGDGVDLYDLDDYKIEEKNVTVNYEIKQPKSTKINLNEDVTKNEFNFAKEIFERYKDLNRTQASDIRFWAYLSHTDYWAYVHKRSPIPKDIDRNEKGKHIITHWFIKNLSPRDLLEHDVARLWWGAYLTYDDTRKDDAYKLTKEFFSHKDYRRTFPTYRIGRLKTFVQAFLEFVILNKEFFSSEKEYKVRELLKAVNRVA